MEIILLYRIKGNAVNDRGRRERSGGKLKTVRQVLEQVNGVILGKEEEIREVMLALLAKGHVLLEDIPGVGKTTMAVAFSRTMLLDYKRVQFSL